VVHLQDDHIDVAFRIGALSDSNLKVIKVGGVRRVICASPTYLKTHGPLNEPDDLSHHHCVTFTGLSNSDRWVFNAAGVEKPVSIRSRLAVNTAEAAIDATIAGLGLTRVLSYQIVAAQNAGLLVTVLEPFEPASVPVSLVFDGQGALPLKLRAFLDFVGPRLKERLLAMAGKL